MAGTILPSEFIPPRSYQHTVILGGQGVNLGDPHSDGIIKRGGTTKKKEEEKLSMLFYFFQKSFA